MPNMPSVWKQQIGGRIEIDLFRKLQKTAEKQGIAIFALVAKTLRDVMREVELDAKDWEWIDGFRKEKDDKRRRRKRLSESKH